MTDDGRAPAATGAGAGGPEPSGAPAGRPTHDICPFLVAAEGGWRSIAPIREHRCTAVTPPAPLAVEKQRRLCLTAEHAMCATYLAAGEARASGQRLAPTRRPVARTTPVVLDQGRWSIPFPEVASRPGIGQGALVALLGLAFVAVLIARLATGGSAGALVPIGSSTPAPSAIAGADATSGPASPGPTLEPSTAPSPTLVPTENEPTANPTARPATYKVKRGDTLSGIALKFGTTVKVLSKLNKIADPSKLHVGQVLKLPKQ